MRILVVDDERLLVKGIKFNLESEGYQVDGAYTGTQALDLFAERRYDLVVLDLMLPEVDGLTVCRRIRENSNVPVIMVTAKSESSDKLLGFEYGADDYMTKPFDILELKARVRAILKRTVQRPEQSSDLLVCGELMLDMMQRGLTVRGEQVELTAREFDLLAVLMENRGRVFSRDDLLTRIWGAGYPGDIRTVDVHVRRLREKLERDDANPEYILTKWGVGYYFRAE